MVNAVLGTTHEVGRGLMLVGVVSTGLVVGGCEAVEQELDTDGATDTAGDTDGEPEPEPPLLCERMNPAKIVPPQSQAYDNVGVSVAIDGNIAAIGAQHHAGTGAVYILRLDGNLSELVAIQGSQVGHDEHFGASIAISDQRILVGAPVGAGEAYFFEIVNGAWTEVQRLPPPPGTIEFGNALALAGDIALIGGMQDNTRVVHVFERGEKGWEPVKTLMAVNGIADEHGTIGPWLALSGKTAMAGGSAGNNNAGVVLIFEDQGLGFSATGQLTAPDPDADDAFGTAVAVRGNLAVVGAPGDDEAGDHTGAAYVFERIDGKWTVMGKLMPSDPWPEDSFGSALAIQSNTIAIAAPIHYHNLSWGTGGVYLFQGAGADWSEMTEVSASDPEGTDLFGHSVALAEGSMLVGAWWDDAPAEDSGSAYVFRGICRPQ